MIARSTKGRGLFDEGFTRRHLLRLGGLVAAATPYGGLAAAGGTTQAPAGRAPARSCILVYLLGGPPHLDMWDLKPDAPAEIRGPFQPIDSTVPGLRICEHLPRLARMADKYAIIRSVSHPNSNHTPMIYYTLTGRHVQTPEADNDISPPSRLDSPHIGSVLARFKQAGQQPGYIALPEVAVRSNLDNIRAAVPLRGGRAGFLGPFYDPLVINGDPRTAEAAPDLVLPPDMPALRFERRQALLAAMQSRSPQPAPGSYAELRQVAVHMTGSPGNEKLYSLDSEPPVLRARYGDHRFGQSLLLARRLAEAGVPLIAIHFNHMTRCDGWDTHGNNFEACRDELLPLVDQGLSALVEDLDGRGLLNETMVVCLGEFGRTPRINANAGRDHWGPCSSAFLAGGGIRGGQVLGASDKHGAFPLRDKVDPVDIHATIYHQMGLDPQQIIYDQLSRPLAICTGRVIEALV